jgi:RHS repeat-associated protein
MIQNKEFSDGSGLELYHAVHRLYDPQIGRFGQIDKFADMSEDMSSYIFASDNPISRNDPYGLKDSVPTLQPVTVVGHKNNSIAPIIFIPQMKQPLDHLSVANIIPTISIPSPNTLLGQLSILEKSKEVAEKGEKVANAAKAIARILKSLLAKGSIGVKELNLLEEYAGDVGPIAALATCGLLIVVNYFLFSRSGVSKKIVNAQPPVLFSNTFTKSLAILFFIITTSFLFWGPIITKSLFENCRYR